MYICFKKYNQTGHYTTRRITKICFFGADGIRHVETDANMPTATVFRLDLMNVILFGVTIYTTSCCCYICCWAYVQWLHLCWNLRRALFARSYSSTTRLDVLESLDDTLHAIQGQNQTTGLWAQVCCGFPKYSEVYNCLGNWCHF